MLPSAFVRKSVGTLHINGLPRLDVVLQHEAQHWSDAPASMHQRDQGPGMRMPACMHDV